MPFSPLPAEFTDLLNDLAHRSNPRIIDFGSGQGELSSLLTGFDLSVWGLDRLPEAAGVAAQLRGDALYPPVLPGSLDCILAGNLVRHLLVQQKTGSFLQLWLELLRPGGCVFIFEDEPGSESEAVRNFKDLQAFLALLMPSTRGPLFSRSQFRKQVSRWTPGQQWSTGVVANAIKPDAEFVCNMLSEGLSAPESPSGAGQLLSRIERHGLSYGSYWWACATIV